MDRILLRITEAAPMLGFARTTLYKLIREHQVPFCRVGKSLRIPVGALEDWAREKGIEFKAAQQAQGNRSIGRNGRGR